MALPQELSSVFMWERPLQCDISTSPCSEVFMAQGPLDGPLVGQEKKRSEEDGLIPTQDTLGASLVMLAMASESSFPCNKKPKVLLSTKGEDSKRGKGRTGRNRRKLPIKCSHSMASWRLPEQQMPQDYMKVN